MRRNRSQRVLADERRALIRAMCEGVCGHPRLAMRLATATDQEAEEWARALRRRVRGMVMEDARDRDEQEKQQADAVEQGDYR